MRQREATEAEELHALDYMAYSYLQEGQDDKAKEIVDFAATVRKTNPEMEFTAAYALAAIPARYALERNDWKGAAALAIPNVPHWSSFPFMEALIEYAHALGRAHTGDLDGARESDRADAAAARRDHRTRSSITLRTISICKSRRRRHG